MLPRDWSPFWVDRTACKPPRPLGPPTLKEGVGDRLRAAAFAEVQARDAFLWAAEKFAEAPADLRNAWKHLASEEQKHLDWLLNRMKELEIDIRERAVNDQLWESFTRCVSAETFCQYMASAEDRGRIAGERFHAKLQKLDPVSAEIFGTIAREERGHIAIARRFYPEKSL